MSLASRRPKIKPSPPPSQTAKVKVLAAQKQTNENRQLDVEQRILDRIQKCLSRAKHPNTPESEAQAAWRVASRLMAQYNVKQADLLEKSSSDSDYAVMGGQSVVAITNTKDALSTVRAQTWVGDIAEAMTILFDCQVYSTRRSWSIEWSFYGIAGNTVAAAMAFETAHNLALEWARSKRGITTKHSYCMGIGRGLIRIAEEEKRREEEQTKEEEKRRERCQQETQIPRRMDTEENGQKVALGLSTNSIDDTDNDAEDEGWITNSDHHGYQNETEDEDDEGEDESEDGDGDGDGDEDGDEVEAEVTFDELDEKPLDLDIDLDQQLRETMAGRTLAASPDLAERDTRGQLTGNPWNTSQALVKFRQSAEKVATEYLKAENIKLRKGRRRETSIKDLNAYHAGQKDSRKIDLKRKRIEDA